MCLQESPRLDSAASSASAGLLGTPNSLHQLQTRSCFRSWGLYFPVEWFRLSEGRVLGCACGRGCAPAQLCLILCDPMDCSSPGSSVHGVSQARMLEWVAISSSRGSSQPRNWTPISWVSWIAGRFFTCWAISAVLYGAVLRAFSSPGLNSTEAVDAHLEAQLGKWHLVMSPDDITLEGS